MIIQSRYTGPQADIVAVAPDVPSWLDDAVFYQIIPDRFANGDASIDPEGVEAWGNPPTRGNFFGGDFAGIESRLDHIQELGANAIYLTPIFEADTNHRYDAADYSRVDHRLGDLQAFRKFLSAAHSRGIRVVLDAVLNHCGEGHWSFRHVLAFGEKSPYVDWFKIERFPIVRDPEPNYATCMGCKYLPQLNHDNRLVRDYLFEITRQWTKEGIDGWRLDVPFLIKKDFWREYRNVVKEIDKDLYIVAEIWEVAGEWVQGDIADGAMNYPLREAIAEYSIGTTSAKDFANQLAVLRHAIPKDAQSGMLNLLGSHDTERILTRLKGDRDLLRIAIALQLTSPGAPLIYYGDEIGFTGGNDPDCRVTMQWDRNSWDHDIFQWHQKLIRLRHEHPALRTFSDRITYAKDDLLVRERSHKEEVLHVVVNRSAKEAKLEPWIVSNAVHDLIMGRTQSTNHREPIIVPPFGVMILALEGSEGHR